MMQNFRKFTIKIYFIHQNTIVQLNRKSRQKYLPKHYPPNLQQKNFQNVISYFVSYCNNDWHNQLFQLTMMQYQLVQCKPNNTITDCSIRVFDIF